MARDAPSAPALRRKSFSHDKEAPRPHHYRVAFDDGSTWELAPTRSGGVMRFDFAATGGDVILEHVTAAAEIHVDAVEPLRVSGYADDRGDLAEGTPRMYFVAQFDSPATTVTALDSPGGAPGIRAAFDRAVVEVRVATSFISTAAAAHALRRDCEALSFEDVAHAAAEEWDSLLGRVRVGSALDTELETLYGCLYRLFLYPNRADEAVDGVRMHAVGLEPESSPAEAAVNAGSLTVNNGFWDTYRTAWPLYALLAPDLAAELLEGFLSFSRESGWLLRWSAPGYVDCMVGTSSDVVFADALARGVPLLSLEEAYDAALKNACVPSASPAVGRKGLARARFLGYTASEIPEGLSWTLEGAICDFAIARMSERLLQTWGPDHPRAAELAANAVYFGSRAQSYRRVFDEESGFFRGRDDQGRFAADFDPLAWGGDYTETNAWGMAFSVPHDGAGLAALSGGAQALRARLDEYFRVPEHAGAAQWGGYGREIHEMVEARALRTGQFALSNQPAHHVPFMYLFTDTPAQTHRITRDAVRRLFVGGDLGQGYPGDEDNGEMSAWWLWCALGLYPLAVGTDDYVITAPHFRHATVDVGRGRQLVVEVVDDQAGDYIQWVEVDGEPWNSAVISHERIAEGATIRVGLGLHPGGWPHESRVGREHPDTLLEDLTSDAGSLRAGGLGAAKEGLLVDDRGEVGVRVLPRAALDWEYERDELVEIYTVTHGGTDLESLGSWTLDGRADGTWIRLDDQVAVDFRWVGETRAFRPRMRVRCDAFRLTFSSELSVAQIELLGVRAD